MHALFHALGAVVVVPYIALALLFVFIGQAAMAKGLWALLDTVVNQADWFVRWGFYGAIVLWAGLFVMGFVPKLQRPASLSLCLLALASLLVIWALHSTRLGLGQWLFLAPCVAVAATSGWLFFRAAAPG